MTCAFDYTNQQCISFGSFKSLSIFALVFASHTVIHCATLASDEAQSGGWHSAKMSEEELAALNSSKPWFQIIQARASGDGKSVNAFLSWRMDENPARTQVRPFFGILSFRFDDRATFLLRLPAFTYSQRLFLAPLDGERQLVAIYDDAETQSVRSAVIWTPSLNETELLTVPSEKPASVLADLAINVARGVSANDVLKEPLPLPPMLSNGRYSTRTHISDPISPAFTVTRGFTPEQLVFVKGTGSLAVACYDTTNAEIKWEIDRAEVAKMISGMPDSKQVIKNVEVWGPIARGGFPHGMPLYVTGLDTSGLRESALLKVEADGNMKPTFRTSQNQYPGIPIVVADDF